MDNLLLLSNLYTNTNRSDSYMFDKFMVLRYKMYNENEFVFHLKYFHYYTTITLTIFLNINLS